MRDITKPYWIKNNIIKNLEANNEDVVTGFWEVRVLDYESNLSINGAEVNIYRFSIRGVDATQGIETLTTTHTTDEDGKIPIVELPVIHEINGESNSENVQYHMVVSASGYDSVTVINIEIFPHTTTVFHVNMSGRTSEIPRNEFVIIPEKH